LLGIPGLRTWRVGKFPLLCCYFVRADHLDVVRLLGERQDILAILGDEFRSNWHCSPHRFSARLAVSDRSAVEHSAGRSTENDPLRSLPMA